MMIILNHSWLFLAVYEETNTIWFSENVPEEVTMYKLIGVSTEEINGCIVLLYCSRVLVLINIAFVCFSRHCAH